MINHLTKYLINYLIDYLIDYLINYLMINVGKKKFGFIELIT